MQNIDNNIKKFSLEVANNGGTKRFKQAFTNIWMDRAEQIISQGDDVSESMSSELMLLRIMIDVLS